MIQQERDWAKTASMREFQGKRHCWPIRTQRPVSYFPKNILIIPKTFGKILIIWGVCPVTSGAKPTQPFIKSTSYQQSNMVVMVWWSGAALQLQNLDDLPKLMEAWILHSTRKSWRTMSTVSLWPQAQVHLGYAAGQWSQTHQQVHLWMTQEKLN